MRPAQIPIVDYLILDDPPYLRAHACEDCGALYFDRRNACARCGGTDFAGRDLSRHGSVRAFTIVHRAGKSVKTPYTSVVVDLEGGGAVKANLLGVSEPERITPQLPVELTTYALGTDDDGVEAVGFGFVPAEAISQEQR